MPEVIDMEELPLGLGMALAQHPEAMARFAGLSEEEQQAKIGRASCRERV